MINAKDWLKIVIKYQGICPTCNKTLDDSKVKAWHFPELSDVKEGKSIRGLGFCNRECLDHYLEA